ncbi:hypothetical protein NG798_09390 [Ancylothrix sp. C2]|uniref:hypothetical protein n=1 Tax=Ancylothrix sp. D3o TaxID=2953691 RepID=UPI0021BB9F4D|nr:hypothetical protein [Ancylothrix sp. D3o]MCT7949999.1 hypothetical protein [Ancylothrix sp. D3o]
MPLEPVFLNRNLSPEITSINQEVLLYTPSIKDSIPLEGYLFDMRLFAKLPSIQELKFAKPAPTEQKPYYSETEIEQYQYNLVSENFPHKLLEIYFSEGLNGEKKYKFSVPLFHRKPHQEVNLLEILTNNPSLMVQNGTHIWGKCSLSADDSISFFMAAYEEGYQQFSDIANLVEYRSLVTLTANQPHTFSLPDNTQAYSFKCRGAGGEIVAPIKWAWSLNDLSDNLFDYLPAHSEEHSAIYPTKSKQLFFQSDTTVTLLVKTWR